VHNNLHTLASGMMPILSQWKRKTLYGATCNN